MNTIPATQWRPRWSDSRAQAALFCSIISLVLHVAAVVAPALVGRMGGSALALPFVLCAATLVAFAVRAFREDEGKESGHLPVWAGLLGLVAILYLTANFVIFVYLMEGGTPDRFGDVYVLSDHGQILRGLSRSEYWRFRGYEFVS